MRQRNVLWLGLRFAAASQFVAVVRTVSVAVIALMVTLSALVMASATAIVVRQQQVEDARAVREPVVIRPDVPSLRSSVITNEWDGRTVTRVIIAGGRGFPRTHPPGIGRSPRPGEVFLSPAVQRSLGSSPVLRRAVGDQEVVGTIGRAGLRSPQELRIVQGVEDRQVRRAVLGITAAFGAITRPLVDLTGALGFFVPLVVLMTFVPLLLALMLVSRLLAPEANQRFALLRAMGVGRATCRVLAAVELLPAAAGGALLGWALFASGWRRLSRLPGTDLTFWPADTRISGLWQVGVPLVSVLFTVGVAGFATVASRARSTRPVHAERRPRWWWLAPFAAGIVLLLYATLVEGDTSPRAKRDAIVAATVMMLGLPLALQALVFGLSERVSRRAPTAARLVAGRWLGNRQGATFRLALGLAVGFLALSVTAPFAASLQGDTRPGQQGLAAANGYNLYVTNLTLAPQAVRQLSGTRQVLALATGRSRNKYPVPVLFASCRQLAGLVPVSGCDGGKQLVNTRRDRLIKAYVSKYEAPMRLPGGQTLAALPTSEVYAPLGDTFLGYVLLPPPTTGRAPPADGYLVNLRDGSTALQLFEADLARVAPAAYYGNDYSTAIAQANSFLGYLQFLQYGVGVALLGTLIALVAASLRSVHERRRDSRVLGVFGASRRTRVRVHAMSQGIPLLSCVLTAVAFSALFWYCLGWIDPSSRVPGVGYLYLLVVAVGLAVLIPLVTLPAAISRTEGRRDRQHQSLWS